MKDVFGNYVIQKLYEHGIIIIFQFFFLIKLKYVRKWLIAKENF